jgi:hypothetical protein
MGLYSCESCYCTSRKPTLEGEICKRCKKEGTGDKCKDVEKNSSICDDCYDNHYCELWLGEKTKNISLCEGCKKPCKKKLCKYCECECKFCRNVRPGMKLSDWECVYDYACDVLNHG